MNIFYRNLIVSVIFILLVVGCIDRPNDLTQVRHFPLDELSEIIAERNVRVDRAISTDGRGSVQITTEEPMVIRLYELDNLNIENARLIYRAKMRTAGVRGRVYLEMLCHFPKRWEFFSRDLSTPLSGTTDWSVEETPFFLQQGQNPDSVKLNLVFEGFGTAWIDDIHLLRGPLPPQ